MRPTSSLLLLAGAAPEALAWGGLGHRTVAYLSTHSFTPATKAFVTNVLANNASWDISDAALWPDDVKRKDRKETASWHFIDAHDNPPYECGVHFDRDCHNDGIPGCIVSALQNMSSIILNPKSSPEALKEATMFTMHFLGDIHQPLHTEFLARGGNEINVCFDSRCGKQNGSVLHSVWDDHIPNKWRNYSGNATGTIDKDAEKKSAQIWAEELYNNTKYGKGYGRGGYREEDECLDITDPVHCSLKWANDSNSYLCSYVFAPGLDWLQKNDLALGYYQGAIPTLEKMIIKAGMRLGSWMNRLIEARAKRIEYLINKERPKSSTGQVHLDLGLEL